MTGLHKENERIVVFEHLVFVQKRTGLNRWYFPNVIDFRKQYVTKRFLFSKDGLNKYPV